MGIGEEGDHEEAREESEGTAVEDKLTKIAKRAKQKGSFNGPVPAPILQPVPTALSSRRPIPKLEGNEITHVAPMVEIPLMAFDRQRAGRKA